MTAFLYYSMSSNFTVDEIIEIDKQVAKSRETVFFFVRNLASNARNKTKKVIVVVLLGGALYFSNVQPSQAIGLSMPPATTMIRVEPSYQDHSKVQIASVITRKQDLVIYNYKSPK
uniref:hypothetical protein n=1 Tax=Navicula tsukamotoi TaxID=2018706 RepID=UPI0021823C6E|nr:hypothetical protein NDC64_pgp099 [Navicula tsukamotoi]UVG41709.1 hypothetical protein [Navicula tsukamotoi]